MAYDFTKFKSETKTIEEWLKKEYQGLRTGQAAPAILDGILVEAYGQSMPINQVAGITAEGARSLRIAPWDNSVIKAIEKAIQVANLGVSVMSDDKGVRVNFPELTSETRTALIKLAKTKLEEARVSVRDARAEVIADIDAKEKEGGMGEDDKRRYKEDLQKLIDTTNKTLEDIFDKKDKEISL